MKTLLIFLFILPLSVFSQNDYITNKEYNEFVVYVRDSLLRYTMGFEVDEEAYHISSWDNGNYEGKDSFTSINWKTKLDINAFEAREALEIWYYTPIERLNRKRELDTRKFIHNGIKIYPDVLIWCRDSTINKSWGTFLAKYYYTHPYFENYPVYGLSNQQIQEYVKWKYPNQNKTINTSAKKSINLNLPKEKLQFTIGEYFQFYKYTRDSTCRMLLCQKLDEYKYCLSVNEYDEEIKPPLVKWKYKINWKDQEVQNILKKAGLLTSEEKIDNRKMMFTFCWLDYYRTITLPDSAERSASIIWASQNICTNEYLKKTSNIDIKKKLKNKTKISFEGLDHWQLKSYYIWKKSNYPTKDIFDRFIPYCSQYSWESNTELFLKYNDIKLLQEGKLTDEFYNFKTTIPIIQIK